MLAFVHSLQTEARYRLLESRSQTLEFLSRVVGYNGFLHQRQVYGYAISAKRYALYTCSGSRVTLIKASEHGLGMYYRPKEGRDSGCEVALWIREGWQWILDRALGLTCEEPDWFPLPVMRRIAISTPSVMAALRKLSRDQARPYNFALSPILVNLSSSPITLLGPFEKQSSRWREMLCLAKTSYTRKMSYLAKS